MTVRAKTISIIGVTLAGVIGALYVILSAVLLGEFGRLEQQHALRNVERAVETLGDDLAGLNETNGDWAPWDDTSTFIETGDPTYVEANLADATFPNLRLSLMLFYDVSGRFVRGKAFDLRAGREMPVPEAFRRLRPDDPLLVHVKPTDSKVGILLLPEGYLEVSSRPIVTSDFTGPIRGTLIMGRYLDVVEMARLQRVTRLSLWAYRLDDAATQRVCLLAKGPWVADGSAHTHQRGPDAIEGHVAVRDIYGKPALLLCVGLPREIYGQARRSLRYVLVSLLVVGAVFGGVSILLVDRVVVSRLARLSAGVAAIGKSGDLSARVSIGGDDEIASLSSAINDTLDSLQAIHQRLEESEQGYRRLFEAVTEQRERLRALAARLADAEEAERRRLAEELHDRVGQSLTALGLNLNLIRSQVGQGDPGSIGLRVDDSLAVVEETTERIRDVMADLRPPVLDDYGLVAALQWYSARLSARAGLNVVVEDPDSLQRLAAPVETSLFRIVQEALANVVRHARAEHATITLEREGSMLRLMVVDDGIGYRPPDVSEADARPGWGLLIMAERAEAVGGRFHVGAGYPRGTRVEVEVPL